VIGILASCVIAAALTGGFLAVRAWRRRSSAPRAGFALGSAVEPSRGGHRGATRLAGARGAVVRGGAVPAARRSEERENKENWRMPPLAMLAPAPMSLARRIGMSAMYVYLGAAIILVVVRVAQIALGG
jgi:hypothetical protein